MKKLLICAVVAFVAAVALVSLSACSKLDVSAAPNVNLEYDEMSVEYNFDAITSEDGQIPAIAVLEIELSDVAAKNALGTALTVRVDDKDYLVQLAIPYESSARSQVVYIVNSVSEISEKLLEVLPKTSWYDVAQKVGAPDDVASTWHALKDYNGFEGQRFRLGSDSITAVATIEWLETEDDMAVLTSLAVERCQAYDLLCTQQIDDPLLHATLHEAIANAYGDAVIAAIAQLTYDEYVERMIAIPLDVPASVAGDYTAYVPCVPEDTYSSIVYDVAAVMSDWQSGDLQSRWATQ
ncbi:MAG: hypothetical protein LBL84_03355 [Candidatus Nomurabacteria bacterium]|jgi:hypothetical protein|nr:hypothetical protein [Candidatus Nomurabacteria bacterium]